MCLTIEDAKYIVDALEDSIINLKYWKKIN
jgi:hypothetical protein